MMRDLVLDFLAALGVENVDDRGSEWIRGSCPLAPWTHAGGTDTRPSWGVRVSEEKGAYFHCFSCGLAGSLHRLLHLLFLYSGEHNKEASYIFSRIQALTEVDEEEVVAVPRKRRIVDAKFSRLIQPRHVEPIRAVPLDVLGRFPLLKLEDDVTRWLIEERRVSWPVIERFGLRLYEDRVFGDRGVVFPVMLKDGRVVDLYVRLVPEKRFFRLTPDLLGSEEKWGASHLLFGWHLVDIEKPVVIVEGALDALRLATLGVRNPVACMGQIRRAQIEAMHARVVYVGFDADEAGRAMAKKFIAETKLPLVYWLDWSLVGVKDAGDLASEAQLREVLRRRKCVARLSRLERWKRVVGSI